MRSSCRRDRPRSGRGLDRRAAHRVRRKTGQLPVFGAPMSSGLVASSADIQVPVMFESRGICGSRSIRPDRKPLNSGTTGSINREWNACDVRTRRATIPSWARRSENLRMFSSDPATTQLPGSLTVAMSTSGERYSAIASGLSATAIMTPRAAACIRRARTDTALAAVGRSKTPATVAATYSPMLCPANAAARTP